jgi:hypothetical protein
MRLQLIAIVMGLCIPTVAIAEMSEICRGAAVPAGWIETDMKWKPTVCGGAGSPKAPNVIVIEKLTGTAVGRTMEVCRWTQTPSGWVDLNTFWKAINNCDPNASPRLHNLKTIRRVQ